MKRALHVIFLVSLAVVIIAAMAVLFRQQGHSDLNEASRPDVVAEEGMETAAENVSDYLGQAHIRLVKGDLLNYDRPLGELLGGGFDKGKVSILVEKSEYRLTLLYDGQPVKQYPIVMGIAVDDKLRAGDGHTPEGSFVLQDLYPHQSFSKFLYINYPNDDSWAKHNQAVREGAIPADAGIGGEIGIHGSAQASQVEKMENWTGGCVALTNADVDEVYTVCRKGTVVTIVP